MVAVLLSGPREHLLEEEFAVSLLVSGLRLPDEDQTLAGQ